MLRIALLIVALALLAAGLALRLRGAADAFPLIAWGLVLALAVVFERWRYRSRDAGRGGPWEVTGERFIDPESGAAMHVLYNPRTGERRYEPAVPADRPPR